MSERYRNRLAKASSPYLQQHSKNPVDWYEWSPQALEKAKAENKLLIISIGYAACHWCHVMERESFMSEEVASIMNNNFICIKVDREERPDIDQVYMNAAQLLNGNGGWPLNAFALPDGKPFYAATYFPQQTWINLLKNIINLYETQKDKLTDQADRLMSGLKGNEVDGLEYDKNKKFEKADFEEFKDSIKSYVDFRKGGFGGAPKFPLPVGINALLNAYFLTKDFDLLEAVNISLLEMLKGGIYDQIGGGFARYSVDEKWFIPHFEKMMYDNAQLVSLYSLAFRHTKNPDYKIVVKETLNWTEREMTAENGSFYSSLNADSEGEEGKFYVWSENELKHNLSDSDFNIISEYFNIDKLGNWEDGKNIPVLTKNRREFAESKSYSISDWTERLNNIKDSLLEVRNKRVRPSTDDKVLCSYNALMITAYADAYLAVKDKKYLELAIKNAEFVRKNMIKSDYSLYRNYKDGIVSIDAFIEDYAFLSEAFLKLYELTFEYEYLDLSNKLVEYSIENFFDDKSGFFYFTSKKSEKLVTRKIEVSDNVIPSPNSVMGILLFKLSKILDKKDYLEKSKNMIIKLNDKMKNGGPYFANWAILQSYFSYGFNEVVILGSHSLSKNHEIQSEYIPNAVFVGGNEEKLPIMKNRLVKGKTLIYICKDSSCKLPLESTEDAIKNLKA